ncbi:MAG: hybrid sensor histidine kinase/response regulator [Myxococcota bacterium]|nr:hybrid sensor histidine kinase/response regulator [Myxococcota bacterium]
MSKTSVDNSPVDTDADRPRRLVIVDDEPVILQILGVVFEEGNWLVSSCSSGTEALEVMRSQGVDILLTDKNLPDVNGLELLREAKEINDLAEVIVITAYANLETALTALELDAFDYVLKPLNNVFEIRKKVERAGDKQRIAEENRQLLRDLAEKNTELQSALVDARNLRDELIQSEKLAGIGTLASGIAHEVSSPLFGIMGLAEAIAEEEDLGDAQKYGAEIVEYSKAIQEIVRDLSSYSRAASSEYLTTVPVSQVVQDAVRLVERTADCQGVTIALELDEAVTISARTTEVQQIFVNLVKNAVEAVGEAHPDGGGEVLVSLAREEGGVLAQVSDNGCGIAVDKQKLVFDPFFTTKAPGDGTGLGLNIVYRIATKYRGNVWVESDGVSGTTFALRFPVED